MELIDAVIHAFENADVAPENFNRKHREDLCEFVFILSSVGNRKRMVKTIFSERFIRSDRDIAEKVIRSILFHRLPHEPETIERVYGFLIVDDAK